MSSKNINSDNDSISKNTNTTFVLSNENIIQNSAQLILENPIVGIDLNGQSSNLFVDSKIGTKSKQNYILDDGPQYDDDELVMRNRGGRINRKIVSNAITSSNNTISTIDEIRQAADEVGLVGNTQTPIIQLSNPNINFLILIYPTKRDSLFKKNGLLVTGTSYYKKLKSELKNENPYSYNIAFDDRFIVKLILKDWIDLFKNLQNLEEESGVTMIRNNFINDDYSIDYNQLIGFIDWFVSKPDYVDFSDKGVIPSPTISFYNLFPQSILSKLIPIPPQPPTPPPAGPRIEGEFSLRGNPVDGLVDNSTLACTLYSPIIGYFSTFALSDLIVGDFIYDSLGSAALSLQPIPTNGNNKWIALRQGSQGAARSLQISSNGEILDIIDCSI